MDPPSSLRRSIAIDDGESSPSPAAQFIEYAKDIQAEIYVDPPADLRWSIDGKRSIATSEPIKSDTSSGEILTTTTFHKVPTADSPPMPRELRSKLEEQNQVAPPSSQTEEENATIEDSSRPQSGWIDTLQNVLRDPFKMPVAAAATLDPLPVESTRPGWFDYTWKTATNYIASFWKDPNSAAVSNRALSHAEHQDKMKALEDMQIKINELFLEINDNTNSAEEKLLAYEEQLDMFRDNLTTLPAVEIKNLQQAICALDLELKGLDHFKLSTCRTSLFYPGNNATSTQLTAATNLTLFKL